MHGGDYDKRTTWALWFSFSAKRNVDHDVTILLDVRYQLHIAIKSPCHEKNIAKHTMVCVLWRIKQTSEVPLSNGWHEAWTAPVIDRYSSGRPWAWGMLNKRRLRNWSLVGLQSSVVHEMLLSVELYGRMTVNFPDAGYFPENVHCHRERILRLDCSRAWPFFRAHIFTILWPILKIYVSF